ncbi:MAG: SusD/RagB family nutrient-binding outer membrane lipoprotein, partial [Prevotella sp.]|nr:SusD/RagB family nutrient-binding outer membrane lipoprotein [Prevotella sp.]MBF1632703.1 SusD/RagB family nutrient-binding outer membrane lipoprotein [Prevotella sp.]
MKSKHIIVLMAMALPTLGLQSCLDYDNPGDEFNSTTKNVEKVTSRGDVDNIPFRQATDAAAADAALNAMQDLLDAGVGGQFSMRGGKNGENPGP